MDLRYPKCGEPWDNDELHDVEGKSYDVAAREFRHKGCEVFGTTHNTVDESTDPTFGLRPSDAASALYELLGDDMDGAASMLEDLGF